MGETLEEVAEKLISTLQDYDSKRFTKAGFKLGAKWQQERMYSEEDMIEYAKYTSKYNVITPEQWFKKFKKK